MPSLNLSGAEDGAGAAALTGKAASDVAAAEARKCRRLSAGIWTLHGAEARSGRTGFIMRGRGGIARGRQPHGAVLLSNICRSRHGGKELLAVLLCRGTSRAWSPYSALRGRPPWHRQPRAGRGASLHCRGFAIMAIHVSCPTCNEEY